MEERKCEKDFELDIRSNGNNYQSQCFRQVL